MYGVFKIVHLLGVVLLLGNITVSAVWKVFADRSGNPSTIAFAQRLIAGTDWSLTLGGVLLTVIGGYGMVVAGDLPLLEPGWLLAGQLLFAASGVIWLGLLVPIQVRQAAMARQFDGSAGVPESYRRLSRRWLAFGLLATAPLLLALAVMVLKRVT